MAEVVCDRCGEWFIPARSDARYCSDACRQQAYRMRRGQQRTYTPLSPAHRAEQAADTAAHVRREQVKAVLLDVLNAKRPTAEQILHAMRVAYDYLDHQGGAS